MANTPLTHNDIADVFRETTLGYMLQNKPKSEKTMHYQSPDAHRPENKRCKDCEYGLTFESSDLSSYCVFNPPVNSTEGLGYGKFPRIDPDLFCGQWKEREVKE